MNMVNVNKPADFPGCKDCRSLDPLDLDFSMAFQPIVNVATRSIFGYEARCHGALDYASLAREVLGETPTVMATRATIDDRGRVEVGEAEPVLDRHAGALRQGLQRRIAGLTAQPVLASNN